MIKSQHRNLSVVCEENYDETSQDVQCRIQNSNPTPSGRKFSRLLGVAPLSLAYYAKNNWASRTLTLLTFGILSSLF
jgi:hypothetical protein